MVGRLTIKIHEKSYKKASILKFNNLLFKIIFLYKINN